MLQYPINQVLNEKWANWSFTEERRVLYETHRKRNHIAFYPPCVSHQSTRKEAYKGHSPFIFEMTLTPCHLPFSALCAWTSDWKSHSYFHNRKQALETPDHGENEVSASCFTVYKAFLSKLFFSVFTIDLVLMMDSVWSARVVPGVQEGFSEWMMVREVLSLSLFTDGSLRKVKLIN